MVRSLPRIYDLTRSVTVPRLSRGKPDYERHRQARHGPLDGLFEAFFGAWAGLVTTLDRKKLIRTRSYTKEPGAKVPSCNFLSFVVHA